MNRRTIIKQLFIGTCAVLVLPSCIQSDKDKRFVFKNIPISNEEETLLAELSETIIPEGKTPGAKKLGLHLFVLKMANDCFTKEEQQIFMKGLTDADGLIATNYKKSFVKCDENEKKLIVSDLEAESFGKDTSRFYALFKNQLINGYVNSEYFMTNIIKYELVPGKYQVHYPVSLTT